MKAIFVGAGCSYGTLGGHPACPPLARYFGRFLAKDTLFRYPELTKVACHLGKQLCEIGMEELWSCIDYHAKFGPGRGGCLNSSWDNGHAVVELKAHALLQAFGRACDQAASDIRSGDFTLKSVLSTLQEGDAIVSFNWDTLTERLAKECCSVKLKHSSCATHPGFVRFAKPHGSASWRLCDGITDGEPNLTSLEVGIEGSDPLVLGAVPIKSELIKEVQLQQGAPAIFTVVMSQWAAAVDAVRNADEFVVLGYSFPKEDHHGRFLLQEGARQRKKHIKRIEYYDPNEIVIEDIRGTFLVDDANTEICWKGKVTSAFSNRNCDRGAV